MADADEKKEDDDVIVEESASPPVAAPADDRIEGRALSLQDAYSRGFPVGTGAGTTVAITAGQGTTAGAPVTLTTGAVTSGTVETGALAIRGDVRFEDAGGVHPRADAGTGRLYYDSTLNQFMVSVSDGSFAPLAVADAPSRSAISKIVTIDASGKTDISEPLPEAEVATVAKVEPGQTPSIDVLVVALAQEVAKLRWELERVKSRVT